MSRSDEQQRVGVAKPKRHACSSDFSSRACPWVIIKICLYLSQGGDDVPCVHGAPFSTSFLLLPPTWNTKGPDARTRDPLYQAM
ncbi:hypothetical protein Y1Q_0009688 [Alligator mississippiensis]|uniref:Uncharacterized protein n=1 Tax=Alligator mississippiensis TaxID=8496 RepID=A0A151MWL5_ALLMI|nr:hypothetical protein Y1Q_0009688 [Alligator mississippiensis]